MNGSGTLFGHERTRTLKQTQMGAAPLFKRSGEEGEPNAIKKPSSRYRKIWLNGKLIDAVLIPDVPSVPTCNVSERHACRNSRPDASPVRSGGKWRNRRSPLCGADQRKDWPNRMDRGHQADLVEHTRRFLTELIFRCSNELCTYSAGIRTEESDSGQ